MQLFNKQFYYSNIKGSEMSISESKVTRAVVRPRTPRTAGGCGDYTGAPQKVPDRVPVPSCRKFTLRVQRTVTLAKTQQQLVESLQRASVAVIATKPATPQQPQHRRPAARSLRVLHPPRCRRSASIDEIMIKRNKEKSKDRTAANRIVYMECGRRDRESTNADEAPSYEGSPTVSRDDELTRAHRASRRVAFVLLLNAWRRRRMQVADANQSSANLESQIEQQRLQIAVLRELISADNCRVATANEEAKKARDAVAEASQEMEQSRSEKTDLQQKISDMEVKILDFNTEIKNARNNILLARSQVTALEGQLAKDREKLCRLREDKKILVDKVKQTEEKLQRKDDDIETLRAVYAQLNERMDEQKMINDTCMDEIETANRTIKDLQDQNGTLEKKEKTTLDALTCRDRELENTRSELGKAQEMIRILTERCTHLQERIEEADAHALAQAERPWWSLAAELATAPLGALHSAARIALPALPPAEQLFIDPDADEKTIRLTDKESSVHMNRSFYDTEPKSLLAQKGSSFTDKNRHQS